MKANTTRTNITKVMMFIRLPPLSYSSEAGAWFFFYIFKFLFVENLVLVLFPFFKLLQKVSFQTEILGNLFKYIFCFILFTSSSPCRKDQFAVSYFSTSLIVLIQVYNGDIRHNSLVCCCGLADVLYILRDFCHISFTITHITPLRIILHSGLPKRST